MCLLILNLEVIIQIFKQSKLSVLVKLKMAFHRALKELTGNSYKINIYKLDLDSEQNTSIVELTISSPSPF